MSWTSYTINRGNLSKKNYNDFLFLSVIVVCRHIVDINRSSRREKIIIVNALCSGTFSKKFSQTKKVSQTSLRPDHPVHFSAVALNTTSRTEKIFTRTKEIFSSPNINAPARNNADNIARDSTNRAERIEGSSRCGAAGSARTTS